MGVEVTCTRTITTRPAPGKCCSGRSSRQFCLSCWRCSPGFGRIVWRCCRTPDTTQRTLWLSRWPLLRSFSNRAGANERKTYGYHRAGVLAAFLNALVLVLLSLWILWESYQRLLKPEVVAEYWMMAVASGGLLLNGGIMWGLRTAHAHDINVRSAFVHMLGDLLGAAAILVGGAIIHWTGALWIDPALSIVIAALIVWTAWDIIQESLNILLEGLPRGLELSDVQAAMCRVKGVLDVHDLHIWSIGSSSHALSCHVLIEDIPPSASNCVLHDINHVLLDEFKICHTTVQFEHVNCAVSEAGCVIPVDAEAHQHHHHSH